MEAPLDERIEIFVRKQRSDFDRFAVLERALRKTLDELFLGTRFEQPETRDQFVSAKGPSII
jgi:hypothetical protein